MPVGADDTSHIPLGGTQERCFNQIQSILRENIPPESELRMLKAGVVGFYAVSCQVVSASLKWKLLLVSNNGPLNVLWKRVFGEKGVLILLLMQ